jgi:hypothetical protein
MIKTFLISALIFSTSLFALDISDQAKEVFSPEVLASFVAYSAAEFFLGRTKIFKSNSAIELAMDVVASGIGIIFRRKF